MYGLSRQDAASPLAGTLIGRLLLRGALTDAEHHALSRFAELRRRYLLSIHAPAPPQSPREAPGERCAPPPVGEAHEWAKGVQDAWEAILTAFEREASQTSLLACIALATPDDVHADHVLFRTDALRMGLCVLQRRFPFPAPDSGL